MPARFFFYPLRQVRSRLGQILLLAPIALGLAACATTQETASMANYKTLEEIPLIPRDVLFGNPDRAAVRLSPDGRWISWLAPDEGVMNIWAAPAAAPDSARVITSERGRGVRSYFWAYDNGHVLYSMDKDGDENWRIYAVDVQTAEARDLTPVEGVQARIQEVSQQFPSEVLIGLNERDPRFHDIFRVNIATGERELLQENPGYRGFVTDDDYNIRFANKYQDDGSVVYLQPDGAEWSTFMTIPEEDTLNTGLAGFDKTGRTVYVFESRGRDTSALTSMNLETGETALIAEDPRADVAGIIAHPTEKTIQAVSFDYDRERWTILDPEIKEDMQFLESVEDGDFTITTRTLDDTKWIVAYLRDNGPTEYYLYNRAEGEADYLFTNNEKLEGRPLASMTPVEIQSRDGMTLVSYLTLPLHARAKNNRPAEPLPMVLLVHGGPWARDAWGYNPMHQLLANRGYAALSVNFRGSTGFGKSFINAGNKEWGAAMHDDLVDAVRWAIAEGIADADRVAIMGGSYGGYATLWGLTNTPELFAAGVDIVGPSNLVTLLESIPPYWTSGKQLFRTRVGDVDTEEGREFLLSRSPLSFVENIEDPLLIGQGANDPRVKQAESDQIVEAMEAKQIPVTYVLYPDEGHGFARPENRISFNAITEAFLARHLGGRYEPIGGSFEGASITVPAGADAVPGLREALGGTTASK